MKSFTFGVEKQNPRKGTETFPIIPFFFETMNGLKNKIPVRGRKLSGTAVCITLFSLTVEKQNPRKGTETLPSLIIHGK